MQSAPSVNVGYGLSSLRCKYSSESAFALLNRVNKTFALSVYENLTAYTKHCPGSVVTFGTSHLSC